jgi:hypothetical protein
MSVVLIAILSCSPSLNDTFNSEELISSKGEKIYINSLNWGVTDDYQLSAVSNSKDKLQQRSDSLNVIRGLEPFIYTFNNDTLTLYFDNEVNYTIKDSFKTINVKYVALSKEEYRKVHEKSYRSNEYHSIPRRKDKNYPSDMPKPPSS